MKTLVHCTLLAAIYYMFALAGLSVAIPPGRSSIVWPAAGAALGAVYLWGPRMLVGVWVGSFLANLWVLPSALDAMLPATGAAVEAFVGAWLMRRCLREPWIFSPGQLLIFFAICFASAFVNGVWGPASLGLEPRATQIRTWVTGDAIGMCMVAPFVAFVAKQAEDHERLELTFREFVAMTEDSEAD